MDRMHSCAARGQDTAEVFRALTAQLPEGARGAQMVVAFYGCGHDDDLLGTELRRYFPNAALLGGSSAGGLMTERGVVDEQGVGLLVLEDAAGEYGAAAGPLGHDPAAAAEALLCQALASCGCEGQLPELVWIYQAPGHEEAVLEGLRRVVGNRCPIIGGTSADETVAGRWRQLGPEGALSDGLVVGVLFPSAAVGFAFQGGYEPAGPSGVVTGIGFEPNGASGVVTVGHGREILSIDGEPAAAVYNRWTGGVIAGALERGGSILQQTTMFPLATDGGRIDGVTHYLLMHPESVTPAGGLRVFRDVAAGTRLFAMRGDRRRLIERAGRVSRQARRRLPDALAVAGALVVYCGGCKIAVDGEIGDVAGAIAESLHGAPFLGCFTFGEQGCLIDSNVHGNLMISAVVFAH